MLSDTTRKLLEDEKRLESKTFIKLLQQRRAELEEDLLAITSCQNAHALPNLLPTEILQKILMDYAKDVYCDWEQDKKLSWFKIMQFVGIGGKWLWTMRLSGLP